MKKLLVIILMCTFLSLTGCGQTSDSKDDKAEITENYTVSSQDSYTDSISSTSESNSAKSDVSIVHTHYYTSSVTKEATCAANGIRTFTCNCGKSYTENIPKKTYHDWEYATCTSPKKCKVCGITEGRATEHNYYSNGKCGGCGQENPIVSQTLAKCSLAVPSVPKSVSYYSYSHKLYSTVRVTNISYKFECNNDGKISLKLFFSGEKTYDYRGSGQSDDCKIGWKLYSSSGSVIESGTFYSPNIAMGESFANQEKTALYTWNNAPADAYRLEISNVN